MSKLDSGDPMATSGPRSWLLVRRAFREFALVPSLVVLGFLLLAVVSVLADESHLPVLAHVRRATDHVIGSSSASTALQAIATGLLTVTSITFSREQASPMQPGLCRFHRIRGAGRRTPRPRRPVERHRGVAQRAVRAG